MTSTNGNAQALAFVDTNILIYALQGDEPKGDLARQLVRQLLRDKALCTSAQILQETYVVSTRKMRRPITPGKALEYIEEIAGGKLAVTGYSEVRAAIELSIAHTISFWDALIFVSAARAGAKRLYTEDLQHGRVWNGVEVVNPFLAPL